MLRPAHEWLITFLSYLLIDRSLSNCRKRGFCLISKLGLWLFWVDQFQKLCAYMKLLCIRHPFQLLYKEKSNFCNSEFLDKFDWKQPECTVQCKKGKTFFKSYEKLTSKVNMRWMRKNRLPLFPCKCFCRCYEIFQVHFLYHKGAWCWVKNKLSIKICIQT